jgi:hypothetical protein
MCAAARCRHNDQPSVLLLVADVGSAGHTYRLFELGEVTADSARAAMTCSCR